MQQRGFSLVELSIVLVILGLLVGGILAGQSLIRASELRSVSADISRYSTAVYAFRDKYFALPGDMANATSFWGTDPDGCPSNTTRVAKTATCNGGANGKLDAGSEEFRSWQHLANAGIISGQFSGVSGPGTIVDSDAGINVPRLKLGDSCITYKYTDGNAAYYYYGMAGNVFMVGKASIYECIEAAMTPEEAWNIDTKMDDGTPGGGLIKPRNAISFPNCSNGADSTAAEALSATYTLTNKTLACGLHYLLK